MFGSSVKTRRIKTETEAHRQRLGKIPSRFREMLTIYQLSTVTCTAHGVLFNFVILISDPDLTPCQHIHVDAFLAYFTAHTE